MMRGTLFSTSQASNMMRGTLFSTSQASKMMRGILFQLALTPNMMQGIMALIISFNQPNTQHDARYHGTYDLFQPA